jgi:hypothetical protein
MDKKIISCFMSQASSCTASMIFLGLFHRRMRVEYFLRSRGSVGSPSWSSQSCMVGQHD